MMLYDTLVMPAEREVPHAPPAPAKRFFSALPISAWVAALLIAFLHILPQLRALSETPPGWTATGNLTVSPDFMQYRVWMRQAVEEGPVVSNRFTAEPNRPYLPVFFYYAIGRVAQATGITPEWVFAWAGSALAFLLTLLLFATTRYFLRDRTAVWTAFVGMLIGGGLGGYLFWIRNSQRLADIAPVRMLLVDPFRQNTTEVIDAIRGNYLVSTIFDTHFLLVWLIVVTALMAFYRTLRTFSWPWLLITALLFLTATVAHVYEGITLLAIAGAITTLCWVKGIRRRESALLTLSCTAAVGAAFVWIAALVKGAGLPMPAWRGVVIHPTLLFMAFPVAWLLLAWGVRRYWRSASLNECFLLGWILGCTALALSAPFYPWPDRGVLSLQVPLTIVAAAIYFNGRRTLNLRVVVICVLLMGSTAATKFADRWKTAGFDPNAPHNFLSPSDRATITALQSRADKKDVLLAAPRDGLWLGPEYRGRHYAGHFFLTVDYDRKQRELTAFWGAPPDQQADFLRQQHIRFVFVNAKKNPARFNSVPGLVQVYAGERGTLFEFKAGPGRAS